MEAWREELYHYGMPKRSGRYPYGSGDRPFQGEGAAGARKRRSLRQVVKDHRTKKRRQKAAAKARDAKANKAKEAEKLAKNMKNPLWLKRHADELTNDQLKNATERIRLENDLRAQSIRKINAGKEYVDLILGYGKTALDVYGTAKDIYDTTNNILGAEKRKEKEAELVSKAKKMTKDQLDMDAKRAAYVDRKMGRNKGKK